MRFPQSPVTAFLLMTTSFVAPLTASAQDAPEFLGNIILSAAGVNTDTLTAPASVTVVTSEQLEASNVSDLTQALRTVPGLSVAGAADGENIFIRGLPAEYTLILIDGKRINTRQSRTNGSGGVEQYYMPPVSSIERIEIVRGPMSSLYGSDAMGGVINIITKPVAPEWGGSVTLETTIPEDSADSSDRQLGFYLNGPVVGDTLGLQVWGRYLDREASERSGRSDRVLTDLNARLTWAVDGNQELTFDIGQTETETDPRLNSRRNFAIGQTAMMGAWDTTVLLSYENAGRTTDGSDRAPEINTTVLDAKASRSFEWNGFHEITVGGQFLNESLSDFNPGLDDDAHYDFSNSQVALFVEDMWEITPDLTMTLGGRYTDDDRFGAEFTPRAYALYEVSDGLFLSGGIATGYATPEIRELVEDYYLTTNRGAAVIQGPPTLNPEKSTSYELGVRFENDRSAFAATAFYTDFDNAIDSRDTGGTVTLNGTTYDLYEYYNVDRARVRGVELSGDTQLTDALKLSGSYTYTDSEQLTGDNIGVALARTPLHAASVRLDWQTPNERLDLWTAAYYTGDSVNISRGSPVEYDGYTTFDIGANFEVNETVTLNTAIYNLGDTETTSDDNGTVISGRNLWVGVTAEF